jgi:cysteine desulfurase/selenocysteine lyase
MISSFKQDFPLFAHHPDLVYLDSASTSHKPYFVVDAVTSYITHTNSNIHRGLYDLAVDSEQLYQWSKTQVWQIIWCPYDHIVYTANATMCYNMLAQSLWYSGVLQAGDHIIVSIAEHHANIVPRQMLSQRHGVIIDRLWLNDDLTLNIHTLPNLMTPRTKVVSLTACSNVLGIRYDLSQIRFLIWDAYFFVDASQYLPHRPLSLENLHADALICTWHKMMAYTGIGVMGLSDRLVRTLVPVRWWGDMIDDVTTQTYTAQSGIQQFETGTPSIISAVSLGYACEYLHRVGYDRIIAQESDFSRMLNTVLDHHRDHVHCVVDHHRDDRHIWSFVVDGWTPIRVAERCADHQICIRFGWHCAHPLIRHLWYQQGWLCRISSYIYNDEFDIQAIDKMFDAIKV